MQTANRRGPEVAQKNQVFEMNKLHDLLYKNNERQERLTNDNFNIEMEFIYGFI